MLTALLIQCPSPCVESVAGEAKDRQEVCHHIESKLEKASSHQRRLTIPFPLIIVPVRWVSFFKVNKRSGTVNVGSWSYCKRKSGGGEGLGQLDLN